MLSEAELKSLFDDFASSAFRLETLDNYVVQSEVERLRAYRAGEPQNVDPETQKWLEFMRSEIDGGKRWHKVHVVRAPLSEYLRFECEWGYAVSTQYGQEVSILDTTEVALPEHLALEDFWLFDEARVVRLIYDDSGVFLGAEPVSDERLADYIGYRNAAVKAAVPFDEYWSAHPQYHSLAEERASQSTR